MFERRQYLAPLSEYTNAPFRLLCQKHGAQGTIVPLVSAKAVIRNKKGFWELDPHPEEKFMGVQLFGSDADDIMEASRRVADGFPYVRFIDINCGCPVRKVMKTGAGSSLLMHPEKAGELIAAASRCGLPVTVKMRMLADNKKTIGFAKACEKAGASALFMHGRTPPQGYSGKADWEIVKSIAESVEIPVIGSGDINSTEEGKQAQESSQCAGFMVGRAAMRDPGVFSGRPADSFEGKLELLKEYYSICTLLGRVYCPDLKAKAIQFFSGFKNSVELRQRLCQAKTIEAISEVLGTGF